MCRRSVAILHYTGPPTVGGVEQLMGVHARLLAERGYPTRIVAGRGEPFHAGVPVQVIPALYSQDPDLLALNEELDRGLVSERFHAAADRVHRWLRSALEGVDVCIVHNAFTLHFNLPLTAALHRMVEGREGPRFVAWCHDLSWKNELYIPKMREAYPWRLLKTPLDPVDYVVVSALRQAELSDLFGRGPERLQVIPAGVDVAAQLKLEPATADLVARLGLLEADLLMLAPVRITRRKNLELSLRITHALVGRGVRARLVVSGPPGPHNVRSGDYVDELRRLRSKLSIEREALFLFEHAPSGDGWWVVGGGESPPPITHHPSPNPHPITDRMMWDLYSLADLLLFTSAQEGFGIPLLEAGLFRLPIFCSDIPPFREIGLDMVGYFELDEDPAAIAGRLLAWMEADPVYRLRRRVLGHYAWESVFSERIEPLLIGR